MEELINILNEISRDLTSAIQQVIEQEALVDTGLLRDTIEVRIDPNSLNIDILAQEYYTYLDDGTRYIRPRNITDKFIQSPFYLAATNRLEEALDNYFQNLI
jgi:hypothetical protein